MVTICQIDLGALTSAVLRKAAHTIDRSGTWVQGDGAFDARGRRVSPTDPDAVCWSVAAALQKVAAELFFESATQGEYDPESAEMEVRRLEEELDETRDNVPEMGSCDDQHLHWPDARDDWEPDDFFWREPDIDAFVERVDEAAAEKLEAQEYARQLEAELEEAEESLDVARGQIESYHTSRHIAEHELVEAALAAVEGYLGGISVHEIAGIGGPKKGSWHAAVELDARALALASILRATADRVDDAHKGPTGFPF